MQFLFEGKNIKNTLFYAFLILCLFFSIKNLDILITLFISIVFACSLNPLVDKLSKKMNRGLSSFLVLFLTIFILFILITLIFVLGAYQVKDLIKAYPTYITNLSSLVGNLDILKNLGLSHIDLSGMLGTIANSASNLLDKGVSFIKEISSALVYCLTGLIFTFLFMKDKKVIKETVLKYFPESMKEKAEEIIDSISQKMGSYVLAQALMMLGVFAVNAIGLLIFKVPYAILLASISGILDIVPVVGPFLGILISVIAVYEFGLKAVITTIIIMAITQLLENNFMRPYVYNKLMNLHPIIIFLSLILGAKYFGFLGVIFGPAFAAMVCILLNELYVKNIK